MSFDDVAANAAFAKKFNFPYKLLCDTERKIGVAYGACENEQSSRPSRISYLIDEQGKVAVVYPKVDTATHATQVLADVARL